MFAEEDVVKLTHNRLLRELAVLPGQEASNQASALIQSLQPDPVLLVDRLLLHRQQLFPIKVSKMLLRKCN